MKKQEGIVTTLCMLVLLVSAAVFAYLWWSEQQQRLTVEKTVERLESSLQSQVGESKDKTAAINDEKSKNVQLQKQLKAAKAEERQAQQDLVTAQAAQQALQASLEKAQNQLLEAETLFEEEKTQLLGEHDSISDLKTSLSSEFEGIKTTLESERDQLKGENASLLEAKVGLENQVTELQSALAAAESSESAMQQAESDKAALISEKTGLEQQITDLKAELTLANEARIKAENALDEVNRSSDSIAQQYQKTQSQLDHERNRSQSYHQAIGSLEERLIKEQGALEELQTELGKLNDLNANLSKENEQLSVEKEQLVKQFRDGTTLIRLPNRVLFPSGSAELNSQGEATLKLVAKTLESFPEHTVSVEGHSDQRTIGPELSVLYPSNWELSSARSSSAIRLLIGQGIPAAQFQAVGYAHTRPLTSAKQSSERNQNRRIEIVLLPPLERTQKILSDTSLTEKN